MLRRGGAMPLIGLFNALAGWIEARHLELMAAEGFDDVRRAHNAVFRHLPADGVRLTELADAAGISKQAIGELVDELERKGYVERHPDPSDGRAKLIVAAPRGELAHAATLRIFRAIEDELTEVAGDAALEQVRTTLDRLFRVVVLGRDGDG